MLASNSLCVEGTRRGTPFSLDFATRANKSLATQSTSPLCVEPPPTVYVFPVLRPPYAVSSTLAPSQQSSTAPRQHVEYTSSCGGREHWHWWMQSLSCATACPSWTDNSGGNKNACLEMNRKIWVLPYTPPGDPNSPPPPQGRIKNLAATDSHPFPFQRKVESGKQRSEAGRKGGQELSDDYQSWGDGLYRAAEVSRSETGAKKDLKANIICGQISEQTHKKYSPWKFLGWMRSTFGGQV